MNFILSKSCTARLQRRRRDIFVETAHQQITSPVGATYSVRSVMPLLRSLNRDCSSNYKYAAPTALPKLRGPSGRAPADAEKATLQNAVTATDQQIDALVYELPGLTEEEIQLVEGNG